MNRDLASKSSCFKPTPTGLDVVGSPTFAEWSEFGDQLRAIQKGYQWWLGDWLLFGEGNYGDRFSQALDASDLAEGSLNQYAWVCREVPRNQRDPNIPFGHYANALAALPAPERADWAEKVIAGDLTQRELKIELKAAHAAKTGIPLTFWLVVSCDSVEDLAELTSRMEAEGRKTKSR